PHPPIPGTHHNHVTGAHRAPLTAAHRDLVTGPEPEGFGVDPDRPRLDPSEGPAVASHPPGVRSGDHRNRLAETCHPNHDALHGNGLLDAGSTPYPAEKVSADRLSGRGEREIDRVVPADLLIQRRPPRVHPREDGGRQSDADQDRKSTRLNSSHVI